MIAPPIAPPIAVPIAPSTTEPIKPIKPARIPTQKPSSNTPSAKEYLAIRHISDQ